MDQTAKKDPRNYDFDRMRKQRLAEEGKTDPPRTEYEPLESPAPDYDDSDMGAQAYICGVPVVVSLGYIGLASWAALPKDEEPEEQDYIDLFVKAFYLFANQDASELLKAKEYLKMRSDRAQDKAVECLGRFAQDAYAFFAASGVEDDFEAFSEQMQRHMGKFAAAAERIPDEEDGGKKNVQY